MYIVNYKYNCFHILQNPIQNQTSSKIKIIDLTKKKLSSHLPVFPLNLKIIPYMIID